MMLKPADQLTDHEAVRSTVGAAASCSTKAFCSANENTFVQTKRKMLADCDLRCIINRPPGVFVFAGAGVKTNLPAKPATPVTSAAAKVPTANRIRSRVWRSAMAYPITIAAP